MLCSICRGWASAVSGKVDEYRAKGKTEGQPPWPSHDHVLHETVASLKQGSESRCFLCRNVLHAISGEVQSLVDSGSDKCRITLILRPDGQVSLLLQGPSGDGVASAEAAEDLQTVCTRMLLMYSGEVTDENTKKVLDECSATDDFSTGSDCSFSLVHHWMNDCIANHALCRKYGSTNPPLPTRVVDVGPPDGSAEPRLYVTGHAPGQYIALSHCWGKAQIITTRTETLAERLAGIPMSALSTTFRHAVEVTRRFGARYLWIDSLCIVQNSAEDWAAEAATMCDVYRNALFTVSAAHASDGTMGCFVERDGLLQRPYVMPFSAPFPKAEGEGGGDPAPSRGALFGPLFPSRREITRDPPIYSRAWVLQEQILSSRLLVYEADQIRWECLVANSSERSPRAGGMSRHVYMRRVQDGICGNAAEFYDPGKPQYAYMPWRETVEDFARRGLTKQADKLIAIKGIADAVARSTGDEYLAGVWRTELWLSLMWFLNSDPASIDMGDGRAAGATRHDAPVAPSWSWASVTAPVSFVDLTGIYDLTQICTVLGAAVSGTPLAQSGTLRLRGPARRVRVQAKGDAPARGELRLHPLLVSRSARYGAFVYTSFYPDGVLPAGAELTLVAIGERLLERDGRWQTHGVALAPVEAEGMEPGAFTRVGAFRWSEDRWTSDELVQEAGPAKKKEKGVGGLFGRAKEFVRDSEAARSLLSKNEAVEKFVSKAVFNEEDPFKEGRMARYQEGSDILVLLPGTEVREVTVV